MNHGLKPVHFVKAKKTSAAQKKKHTSDEELARQTEEENGKEVRAFYESVISTTSDSKSDEKAVVKEKCVHHKHSRRKKERQAKYKQGGDKNVKERTSEGTLNELLRNCQEGNLREVKRIIDKGGASLRDGDQYGWNALMCAAYSGHANVVSYILTRDPLLCDHKNKRGQSAEDLAHIAGHDRIVKFMQEFDHSSSDKSRQCHSKGCDISLEQPFWCEVCKAEFRDKKQMHNKSTAHLFNCGHAPNPTLYHIPESNRGFQMMIQDGWDKERGLGKGGEGRKFPVKTVLKRDRQGLGVSSEDDRPRITHFKPFDRDAVKQPKKKRIVKEQDSSKVKGGQPNKRGHTSVTNKHKAMEVDFRRSFNM